MCRNPKAFYDAMAGINGADALIPEWKRVAYWEDERCEVSLTLSHFSESELEGARIEWHLDLFPEINGVLKRVKPQKAHITKLGKVAFNVPPLHESVRARLELRLIDAHGVEVTRNHQELYFFPRRLAQTPSLRVSASPRLARQLQSLGYELTDDWETADLVVADKLTDEIRFFVQNGGRVLWLAESNDAQQSYLGPIEVVQRQGRRWQGDWASNMNWIRQDGMFGEIPSGGTVDFAFADLTPEHVITGISPRDFMANVHAGLFIGWLHHIVALVAEKRYGDGRLLISTFRLREHLATHPVAAIMLRDMIAHLSKETAVNEKKETEVEAAMSL
jgi:hypothetical protein